MAPTVDHKVHANVTVAPGASTQAYTLVSELPPGTHRVTAFKVTEDLELSSADLSAGGGSELHKVY